MRKFLLALTLLSASLSTTAFAQQAGPTAKSLEGVSPQFFEDYQMPLASLTAAPRAGSLLLSLSEIKKAAA